MLDSLSEPMRMLVSRLAVLAIGVLVGVALYALGVAGPVVVPVAAVAAIAAGEGYFAVAGDGPST